MRSPFKLNRTFWVRTINKILPSAEDPRALFINPTDEVSFSKAVSALRFGKTYKTTQKARYPHTIQALTSIFCNSLPIILDVGASDGITSLDVMQSVPFKKYFVTDLNIEVYYKQSNKSVYFYDEEGVCILIVTEKWIIYPVTEDAVFPFKQIAELSFNNIPKFEDTSNRVFLINPALQKQKSQKIFIEKYNIMETWPHEKVNLVIAANVLNRSYFSEDQIQLAFRNMISAINNKGRIAIIDNRDVEKSTIFLFVDGGVAIENRVNGGTEIEHLVMQTGPFYT